jgi:hypothetical protein
LTVSTRVCVMIPTGHHDELDNDQKGVGVGRSCGRHSRGLVLGDVLSVPCRRDDRCGGGKHVHRRLGETRRRAHKGRPGWCQRWRFSGSPRTLVATTMKVTHL